MKRLAVTAALLVTVPLAACGGGGTGTLPGDATPDGPLQARILDFQEDGFARQHGGAISDEPIDPQGVFGRDGIPPEPVHGDVAYVAVSSFSGCYLAIDAELHRDGNNLQVEFEIDRTFDNIHCLRSFEPYVQFAVDADDVEGVKTIQGQPPLNQLG